MCTGCRASRSAGDATSVLERYVPGREAGYTRKTVGSAGVIKYFYIYFLGPPFNLVLFAVVVAETFAFLPDARPGPLLRLRRAVPTHSKSGISGTGRPRGRLPLQTELPKLSTP